MSGKRIVIGRKSPARLPEALYGRVRQILESARTSAARSVNTAQVVANWMVGREIVEEEQHGQVRAEYAEGLVAALSERLGGDYGAGYSAQNLWYMRQFYLAYPALTGGVTDARKILHAVRGELTESQQKRQKRAGNSVEEILHAVRGELDGWAPGRLHPGLSWTHYRTLLRVDRKPARAFYEIEAARHAWSARELERQINSLLFERLAKSRDKKGLMKLASEGHTVSMPVDVFKDPMVIESLG